MAADREEESAPVDGGDYGTAATSVCSVAIAISASMSHLRSLSLFGEPSPPFPGCRTTPREREITGVPGLRIPPPMLHAHSSRAGTRPPVRRSRRRHPASVRPTDRSHHPTIEHQIDADPASHLLLAFGSCRLEMFRRTAARSRCHGSARGVLMRSAEG